MKKQLSSFDIFVIVEEIQDYLDYNIEKIYQISRDEIVIKLKNLKNKDKISLYIKNGEFLTITTKQFETPLKPTTFAMTLRKHITNGKILKISQFEFDRIIEITIMKKDIEFTLIIEFFSKGNIILINNEKKILSTLITQHWSHRKIKIKETYISPPSQINPFILKKENFSDLLKESKSDIVRTLAVTINLSGSIAEEICVNVPIKKDKNILDITDEEIEKIYIELKKFLKLFLNKKFDPIIVYENSEIIDIKPFKFEIYKNANCEKTESFIKSFEKYITYEKTDIKKIKTNDELIEKIKRRIIQQNKIIEKFKNEIIEKKIEGDIIYLNYEKCDTLLREISEILLLKNKENEIKRINKNSFVKEFNPLDNLLTIIIKDENNKDHIIKLDFRKTISENAENAYQLRKKYKQKLLGAEKSIEKSKTDLKKAIKYNLEIINIKNKKPLGKKFWFENYRWFISSEGNIIIGGKDSNSNERIVKKYLKPGDRYAHADITGAPSCIIKNIDINNKNIDINEDTLKEACIFAACYSKAWNQFSEAQSYWVLPDQVSKTPQSGEYVPKGAFIIRGKRNYYKSNLELALGEIFIEKTKKFMAGPITSIEKYSKKYLIIKPGNVKKNDASKIISRELGTTSEDILKILPPGNISIIKTVGLTLESWEKTK
jgi:predicted ribosome quality control (RQC) complex YloA/Tae2 family protein